MIKAEKTAGSVKTKQLKNGKSGLKIKKADVKAPSVAKAEAPSTENKYKTLIAKKRKISETDTEKEAPKESSGEFKQNPC
jgi:hypothetical protein